MKEYQNSDIRLILWFELKFFAPNEIYHFLINNILNNYIIF